MGGITQKFFSTKIQNHQSEHYVTLRLFSFIISTIFPSRRVNDCTYITGQTRNAVLPDALNLVVNQLPWVSSAEHFSSGLYHGIILNIVEYRGVGLVHYSSTHRNRHNKLTYITC